MDPVRVGATSDSAQTSFRLTAALLGYFLLVTLVITLSPFEFASPNPALFLAVVPSDIVANVALFLPLGFLLRGMTARGRGPVVASVGRGLWIAVGCGAGLSLAIEVAQIFIRGRYVAPTDFIANTAGAWLGAIVRERIERSSLWHPDTVGRLRLETPLVGLLYLLLPLLWLSSAGLTQDPWRGVGIVTLACATGFVLLALRDYKPERSARRGEERRFETDTLRRFLPLFTFYLIITALWPPFRAPTAWHGAVAFADRMQGVTVVHILALLEHVAAFTLLGYAAAEYRGRLELSLAQDLPRIMMSTMLLACGLEVAQGFLVGGGASLLRAVIAGIGATYGVAVYHLARAHVRALRPAHASSSDHQSRAA